MKRDDFLIHIHERNSKRLLLLQQKGAAYSGDADAFANFKRNGEKLGLSRFHIWAVYCGKHLDAIFGAIRRNPSAPVDPSEGMEGRIDDAINYLELLSGMLRESELGNGNAAHSYQHVPTNRDVAERLAQLFGGNGLSTKQQVEMATDLLNEFYGPRHFSL